MMRPGTLIAVNWGTTHVRAYRLDADGRILERRTAPEGVLSVAAGAFPDTLERLVGDWHAAEAPPVLLSGMVGSRQGWAEVPYVPCPASVDDIIAGIRQVAWPGRGQVLICPGLVCRDSNGAVDVLRGEEIEVLGALGRLPPGRVTICLPGTHSKYVTVQDGIIEGFSTHMTGELFASLTAEGMLGRVLAPSGRDTAAFDSGVLRAGQAGGLLHHLFGVRAAVLVGELSSGSATDYLSGLLIGYEIDQAKPEAPLFLSAAAALADHYARAFELAGRHPLRLDSDVAAAGLYRVGQTMLERTSS